MAAGAIAGRAWKEARLKRFGYITLYAKEGSDAEKYWGDAFPVRGHEFHYYESTGCGSDCLARKPESTRSWECMIATKTLLAGYPHLYFYSNPGIAACFLKKCACRAGR